MVRVGYAAFAFLAALVLLVPALAQQPPASAQPANAPGAAVPAAPPAALPLPEPDQLQLIDVPNDAGNQIAAQWAWKGEAGPDVTPDLEIKSDTNLLKHYELTEAQRNRVSNAREALKTELAPLLPERDRLKDELAKALDARTTLENAPADQQDKPALATARQEFWRISNELAAMQQKIEAAKDKFGRATRAWSWSKLSTLDLAERGQQYDWLQAALGSNEYLKTNTQGLQTRGDHTELFGAHPSEPEKLLLIADSLVVPNPDPIFGKGNVLLKAASHGHDEYDESPPPAMTLPLEAGQMYVARLVVGNPTTMRFYDAGAVEPRTNWFKSTATNNFVIALLFALIVLVAISVAKRQGHKLFVRRIAGLEAVDEAIGRATEMGKPVLYLNGMTDLTDLSTLAAVNILGRVARRIADYDSQLLVPCRDPVVMTVAQEIVRSNYLDAGRPDAYREQDIFFLTQDQFSYTAATCGIMLRDRPAANFFMGYYYAESLLLAETGQSTGAIQIAGTDSQAQLPFLITTCDYTLIGEELYAASAYLSREPLLLGSLKGQDLAKLAMMVMIVLQTMLFLYKVLAHSEAPLDFIRNLVQPL